jgi:hypothetical protein
MSAQRHETPVVPAGVEAPRQTNLYQEGVTAGLLAAATIAVIFLIIDLVNGRAFYTPNVLGTALFRRGQGLESPETLPIAPQVVFMFTWIHALAFAVIGGITAWLLDVAERRPNVGFGIVILFALFFGIFEFGLVAVAAIFAEPVLRALSWPAILIANLIAVAVMAAYFRFRHPHLRIWP